MSPVRQTALQIPNKFCVLLLKFVLITSILCIQCNTEEKRNKKLKQELMGTWILTEATRNGDPAPTLHDAFFTFQEKDILKTNFTGQEKEFPYVIQKDTISLIGEVTYKLHFKKMDPKKIQFGLNVGGYDFIMQVVRPSR